MKKRARETEGVISGCVSLTVGLVSLKINKFFDDKESIDSLIPSLAPTPYSPQLCSLSLSLSLSGLLFCSCCFEGMKLVGESGVFASEGWGVAAGALTATLLYLLSPQLPAFSFIRSALTLCAFQPSEPSSVFSVAQEVKPLSLQSRFLSLEESRLKK